MSKCVLKAFYKDGFIRVVGDHYDKTFDVRYSVDAVKDSIGFYLASLN